MKKLKLVLLIILATSFTAIHAQNTQTLRGKVTDADTGWPIPGASIVIRNSDPLRGTVTDIDGEFKLENITVGRHNLQISFMGYQPAGMSNIIVESGKETVLEVPLQESTIETEEVVVNGGTNKSQANNEMAVVSARSFSVEETERYAGSLGDPSRMAANFAGVSSVSDQRNDIIIRGNSPSGLLWVLDGVIIPNPNHFGAMGTTGGPVSMLNNNLLNNSDFYTGAFPAQYGNAVSGVFDLKMRSGNNQTHEFLGQVGFNGFELGAEGPFSSNSKASYLINYRYSTLGLMNAMGVNFGTGASVPQYQDLSFKVNVPTKKGKISLFGIGGLSYIELLTNPEDTTSASFGMGGTNTYFGSDMGVVGLTHLHFFTPSTRLETTISAQGTRVTTTVDSIRDDESTYKFYGDNSSETKYAFSTTLKKKFNAKNNARVGFSSDMYNISFVDSVKRNLLEFEENPLLAEYRILTDSKDNFILTQLFAEWQHRPSDRLTLYSGVHAQHFSLNNSMAVEPRLSAKLTISKKHSIHAGIGMHSILQPHKLYFVQTTLADGTVEKTNTDLDFSKSNQAVLGYDYNINENTRIKAEVYYQQLSNIPVSPQYTRYSALNEGADFANPTIANLVNEGTGTNYGAELTVERFYNKGFYFLFTTSVFESKYKGYDKIERNTAFNGNFVVNGLVGYEFKIGKNNALTFDIKQVVAGGKRKIPVLLEESILAGKGVYDYENSYKERYDNYSKTDIRIGFKMNSKKYSQEWAVDIQNLTNNKNVFQETYNAQTGRVQTDYQTGIFPMMLWRIRF